MAGQLTPPPLAESAALPVSGISESLSAFAVAVRWEDLPDAVRHEAKRALVNFFGTALAGCRDPALQAAAAVFQRFSAGNACTIIGHGARTDARHAASLNAMSGNVFDFDDTHLPTIIHPTAPVAPALLALAQTRPMSGKELLLAFLVGVEIECRLGNAVSPWHYQRGWHITSTCGVFGAAAACARAIGLDAVRSTWALGNAAAQSSGLVETLGSMAKSIGVGNAAANGLLSALLAAEGFQGPQQPIEGPRGFLRVMGQEPDLASVTAGLGERWEIMSNTYKPYPCGVVLNPVIEACLALHHEPALALPEVERIELAGHTLLRERTDRPSPRSGREAQVSAQHAVAVSLTLGRAGLDEFSDECAASPEWKQLGSRTHFIDDDSFGVESARVTVRLRGGAMLTRHIHAARGSLTAPLTDRDLEAKLKELAAWGGSGCAPQPLVDALWALDERGDAGSLMPLAAGARP
jgi:2-methylcitrate dehydratase PrpD